MSIKKVYTGLWRANNDKPDVIEKSDWQGKTSGLYECYVEVDSSKIISKLTFTRTSGGVLNVFGVSGIVDINHTSTITFNTNGGSTIDNQKIVKGSKITKPENPTKDDLVFVGWYSDSELTKEFDFNSSISDDVNLYAKWREYEKGKLLVNKTLNLNTIGAKIIMDDDIASKIELTADEITHMENGRNVSLYLEVKDISDSILSEDKEIIETKLSSNDKIGMHLDVNLFKKVEGELATKITKTKEPIKISFEIPVELLTVDSNITRTFKILRLHDGEVTELETEVIGNIGTFETDEFSTYSLIYSDTTNNNSLTTGDNTNNPQTSDNIVFYISMLVLSIIGLTVTGLYIRKRRFN